MAVEVVLVDAEGVVVVAAEGVVVIAGVAGAAEGLLAGGT
jgi:hypothetical protein